MKMKVLAINLVAAGVVAAVAGGIEKYEPSLFSRAVAAGSAMPAAAMSAAPAAVGSPMSDLPAPRAQGEVTYLSGGVGLDEANAFKRVAKDYPLELDFLAKAKSKDEYLANVKVRIKDARDKLVLSTTSEGPFLLARMPAGKYTISADHDGNIEQRKIEIAAGTHRRVVFEWRS